MKWLPIETAPKSTWGEPVRLLLYGEMFGIAFGRVYEIDANSNEIHTVVDGYHGNWNPTHWMPLPEAPKD